MSFRNTRIATNEIEEFGGLKILCGSEVTLIDESRQRLVFSGQQNPRLEIASSESKVEINGTARADLSELQGKRILTADALKDGSLRIVFEDGSKLTVPFGNYEPWELRTDGTLHVVSVAGGGIAIWP